METLPRDILFNILLHLKNSNLLNLCNTNSRLYNFCSESNEYFWQRKVLVDYQNRKILPKPANLSWKQYYIELGTTNNFIKQIPVYFEQNRIGYIWISVNDTEADILKNSNKLFLLKYPHDNPVLLDNDIFGSLHWYQPLTVEGQDKIISKEDYNRTQKLIYTLTGYMERDAQLAINFANSLGARLQ